MATRTSNDYDNYGVISSSDIDFWRVAFSSEGMANFWLGNIPSGCDYDLFVYRRQNANYPLTLVGESLNVSNSQEFLRIHVKPFNEAEYIIGICSATNNVNSSAQYMMRVKNNPGVSAQYFSYTDEYWISTLGHPLATNLGIVFGNLNTYTWSADTRSILTSMGYDSGYLSWVDKSAGFIKNNMALSDITVIDTHGCPGLVATPSEYGPSCLYAVSPSFGSNSDADLSSLATGGLNGTTLVIFNGCETGCTDTIMGNLVDVALSKGAYNAIGWTEIQWTDESAEWMETFFTAASQGLTLEAAMVRADNKVRNLYGNNCSMLSHYTGNGTYLDSTILN